MNFNYIIKKKSLFNVIYYILLILVLIIFFIIVQNWNENLVPSLFNDFEKDNSSFYKNTGIEKVDETKIYFKNTMTKRLIVKEILIDEVVCNSDDYILEQGINFINITECVKSVNVGTHIIRVITNYKIFEKVAIFY